MQYPDHLRHAFGMHLSVAGVHRRTTMSSMRHSRIELTMNYYTDPVLLDVAGAVEALTDFVIDKSIGSQRRMSPASRQLCLLFSLEFY